MLILGLGSNIGDRLANLRKALAALNQLAHLSVKVVSPVYISEALLPDNAPADWDTPYLNASLRCETTLDPFELLKKIKEIEWSIGRKPAKRHWGPREIDIDILAIDDLILNTEKLTLPHVSMLDRPFVLWPVADVAPFWQHPSTGKTAAEYAEKWGSRFSGEAPFSTKQIQQRIDTPELVGIINLTPDSFSDGGQFHQTERAVQQAHQLIDAGADILDLGAESTAPGSHKIDVKKEWQRLEPVLSAITQAKKHFLLPVKISIDTRHAAVAEKALVFDIDWINDVTGLADPAMQSLIAESKIDCVMMHHLSIPPSKQAVLKRNQSPISQLLDWGKRHIDTLEKAGILPEKIIFDPGIGFGKTAEQSFDIIKQAGLFKQLGTRVLIGHSRKSFLSLITNAKFADRDIETLALSLKLARGPVDYLRVHNIDMTARGIKAMKSIL